MKLAIRTGLLATACLTFAGATRAAPPATDTGAPIFLPLDQDFTSAVLIATPANEDLEREYPRIPLMMGLGGEATMTCKALANGSLSDCHVVSESPEGLGFGVATVRTAVYFLVKPATRDGKPVEGTITIPLRWQTQDQPALQPLALAPASPAALALGRRLVELQGIAGRMQARWRPVLEQQNAQLVASSDLQTGQAMMDAFKQGLNEMTQQEAERRAHVLAAHESEADLKAAVAFLESPPGHAFIAADAHATDDMPTDFGQRVAAAARAHFCPDGACPLAKTAAASR